MERKGADCGGYALVIREAKSIKGIEERHSLAMRQSDVVNRLPLPLMRLRACHSPCTLRISRAIVAGIDLLLLTVADSLCVEALTTDVI